MGLINFVKTIWNNGGPPGISAHQLNRIENGIKALDDLTTATAEPNKLLTLNAQGKLPADITGDAQGIEGLPFYKYGNEITIFQRLDELEAWEGNNYIKIVCQADIVAGGFYRVTGELKSASNRSASINVRMEIGRPATSSSSSLRSLTVTHQLEYVSFDFNIGYVPFGASICVTISAGGGVGARAWLRNFRIRASSSTVGEIIVPQWRGVD